MNPPLIFDVHKMDVPDYEQTRWGFLLLSLMPLPCMSDCTCTERLRSSVNMTIPLTVKFERLQRSVSFPGHVAGPVDVEGHIGVKYFDGPTLFHWRPFEKRLCGISR